MQIVRMDATIMRGRRFGDRQNGDKEEKVFSKKKLLVPAVIALALVAAMSPVLVAADDFRSGYTLGMDHGKSDSPMLNVLWGIVGGPIALAVVAFTPPADPGAVRLMALEGKPAEYKEGYFEGYSSGRQQMRYLYTGAGAALTIVILFLGI